MKACAFLLLAAAACCSWSGLAGRSAKRIAAEDAEPIGGTPEEFRAFIGREAERWAQVLRKAGVRLE